MQTTQHTTHTTALHTHTTARHTHARPQRQTGQKRKLQWAAQRRGQGSMSHRFPGRGRRFQPPNRGKGARQVEGGGERRSHGSTGLAPPNESAVRYQEPVARLALVAPTPLLSVTSHQTRPGASRNLTIPKAGSQTRPGGSRNRTFPKAGSQTRPGGPTLTLLVPVARHALAPAGTGPSQKPVARTLPW